MAFTVFIDESGDEGYNIVPPPNRRSSEWFVLGGAICATADLSELQSVFNPANPFHFRNERHHECVAFAEKVAALPITAIAIAFHKLSTPPEAALRNKKHYLFDYCTKLLIERISWYCANHKAPGPAEIIFSRRGQLNLERIRAYIRHLSMLTHLSSGGIRIFEAKNSIKWHVIDTNRIDMQPHDSLPGLQIADAIVSGCAKAIEWSPSYNTEHRYLKIIKDRFYRHNGRCTSYGLKMLPADLPAREHNQPRQRFHWLHHFK